MYAIEIKESFVEKLPSYGVHTITFHGISHTSPTHVSHHTSLTSLTSLLVGMSLFVASETFGDFGMSLFVAGAILGDVGASLLWQVQLVMAGATCGNFGP